MRLIHAFCHWWLIKAARRDMRAAAFYVSRAEVRLKAVGLELPLPMGAVLPRITHSR